jgi:hypothetical protein
MNPNVPINPNVFTINSNVPINATAPIINSNMPAINSNVPINASAPIINYNVPINQFAPTINQNAHMNPNVSLSTQTPANAGLDLVISDNFEQYPISNINRYNTFISFEIDSNSFCNDDHVYENLLTQNYSENDLTLPLNSEIYISNSATFSFKS